MLGDLERGEQGDWEALVRLVARGGVAVLTGAGCSTESGIPDYRGEGRPSSSRHSIQHRDFLERVDVRRRYWARATLGWSRFSGARPNAAHHALADLERFGHVVGLITQNVDRLHHHAGSERVIELHGALARVTCIDCGVRIERAEVHRRLLDANPGWLDRAVHVAPDGDSEIDPADVASFRLVECGSCDGRLKPDVVFFGGSVPPDVVAAGYELIDRAEALVVVGSSLAVYSGFRFVLRANARKVPVAIINLGPSRADRFALAARIRAPAGRVLARLAGEVGTGVRASSAGRPDTTGFQEG
jgi:NAD-dependent SIR2 family protein deacetylase